MLIGLKLNPVHLSLSTSVPSALRSTDSFGLALLRTKIGTVLLVDLLSRLLFSFPFSFPPFVAISAICESDSRNGWTEFPGPFAKGAILGDSAAKPGKCMGGENGVGELSAIPGHKSTCTYRIASESFLYIPCSRKSAFELLFCLCCSWNLVDSLQTRTVIHTR